ncbi:thiamine phosphate synthase [Salinicola rhizosphaerae]|uniref:Thiamine-phosphate synthase n=1 Tax=Salinicola rhizosphaerae TaxID=1443141 RepID=A0ABQ3DUW2_9GAMM|nr:thiamine phosphate synthase [Salinicola rhizosphaerae]GHB14066.1 thiamine-phosphate synthase [Salinicola rhizosphaerae]
MVAALDNPALRGIYAITDSHLLPDDRSLLGACETALEAGIALLQYRDKSADDALRWRQSDALAALCERHAVPLIINDDLALAQRLQQRWGASIGLHLGQEDARLSEARERLGGAAIIGATCYDSTRLATAAAQAGASYLAFGRFFASKTKPEASPARLSVLSEVATLGLPRVAIGGIDIDTAGQARAAGAEMLAVVHAIFGMPDIAGAVRALATAVDATAAVGQR